MGKPYTQGMDTQRKPEPTDFRDAKGRRLWNKWCKTCGKYTRTRYEHISKLCLSCGKAQGKGFPPGCLVDPEDTHLARFSWNLNNSGYVKGPGGELHRVIMKAKKGQELHHKNHNKLDNRKANLEFIDHSENLLRSWDNRKNRIRLRESEISFF